MKRFNVPDISVPEVSLSDAPDVGGFADDVLDSVIDLAGHAADAISSAAGLVPGVDDYRASNRGRNVVLSIAAIAAVLALVAYLKKRSSGSDDRR